MDVRSMTGFGKAEKETDGKKITVEIRSLNSKQLDLAVKLPLVYRCIEADIRKALTQKIGRGKADVSINIENTATSTNADINADAFSVYYNKLAEISKQIGFDINNQEIVTAILKLPEVISVNNNTPAENDIQTIVDCCNIAFNQFDQFRIKEGTALINDIIARVNTIDESIAKLESFEKGRVEAIKARIEAGLQEIVSDNIDKNRLEQELIYYIEKMDITEEKVRLHQHCQYFNQVSNELAPGRKLGFIAQEIGREINTIGSKSNDADMQRIVVEMKDELEKIKEQLLNVL